MNEQELIELIQNTLPAELTGGQIAELREKMRQMPELREALLEEITLEQGLATRYAPGVESVEEVVDRIVARIAERKRRRGFRMGLAALLAVGAVAGGGLLIARLSRPAAQGLPVAATDPPGKPPAAGPATTAPSAAVERSPASAPATPPRDANAGAREPIAAATTEAPEPPARDDPNAPPDWRLFQEPAARKDGSWIRDFGRLFQPIGSYHHRNRDYFLEARGRYRLVSPPSRTTMLRLSPVDVRELSLEFWNGNEGVEVDLDEDGSIRGYFLDRRRGGDGVRRLVAEDWRWRLFRRGLLDIHYQDGRIVVARGRVPLVALPLAKAPEEAFLRADCTLSFAQAAPAVRLRLPGKADRPARVVLDSDSPGGLKWTTDRLEGARLARGADGSVTLTGSKLKDDGASEVELDAGSGREVCLLLRDVSPWSGFAVRSPDRDESARFYVVEHRGAKVLVRNPDDGGERERAYKAGLTVGDNLWVRIATALDHVDVSVGPDGANWGPLWRHDYGDGSEIDEKMGFGLLLRRGRDDLRVRVARIRIGVMDALERLADADLVKRVPDSKEMGQARSWSDLAGLLANGRPAGCPEWKWRIAVDAAALGRCRYARARRGAGADLLATAAAHTDDLEAVLRAAEEFAARTNLRVDGESWRALMDFYDDLGRSLYEAGRRDRLGEVLGSWIGRAVAPVRGEGEARTILPPMLPRLLLYHLLDRGGWEEMRWQCPQIAFLLRDRKGDLPRDSDTADLIKLAEWMHTEARANLGELVADETDAWQTAWTHPLTVQMDRETLNMISEFVASVNIKAYHHAAKVLAEQMLPDGIVPTDTEDRLYQSIHFRIRELIRTHPELGRELAERFAPIGMIRLQRALREGDVGTLESLAVQFHGTEAAYGALAGLADRDLSTGNVFGAAAKYRALIAAGDGARKPEFAAKYRLAAALGGQLEGEPATQPVELPGKTLSAEEFEQMVAGLAKGRRTGGSETFAVRQPPRAPAPAPASVETLCEVAADRDEGHRPFYDTLGYAQAGRDLLVRQTGRLFAVNLDSRRTAWSYDIELKGAYQGQPFPAAPLVAGTHVYTWLPEGWRPVLACLDRRDGKLLWRQGYDDGVLSDPVLINSWLYVLTCRGATTSTTDLYLRRISPETGRSVASAALIRLRREPRKLNPCRFVLSGDLLVFRCASTLVCCTTLGEVRWIRKLTFIPPEVDDRLQKNQLPGDLLVHETRVILNCPTSPHIECVDVDTGRQVWSYLQPELRKLVGIAGGKVILTTGEKIEAVDAATGRLAWAVPDAADPDAVLPGEKDTVLSVRLDDPKDKQPQPRVREVRWLSAADGSVVRAETLAEQGLTDATRLHGTGREVVGVASYDRGRRTAKLFVLRTK